jgi:hypothetical protein
MSGSLTENGAAFGANRSQARPRSAPLLSCVLELRGIAGELVTKNKVPTARTTAPTCKYGRRRVLSRMIANLRRRKSQGSEFSLQKHPWPFISARLQRSRMFVAREVSVFSSLSVGPGLRRDQKCPTYSFAAPPPSFRSNEMTSATSVTGNPGYPDYHP